MPSTWNNDYFKEIERTYGQRVQSAGYYLVTRIRENISTPGTRKAASSFAGLGRHHTVAAIGPVEKGQEFVEGSKSRINDFGIAGKRYRKGRNIYGASPSKPGEFPHKQYGTLRQSIAQEFDGKLTTRVGTPLEYGRHLELGTRKMGQRSFLRRTLAEEKNKITEIITGAAQ